MASSSKSHKRSFSECERETFTVSKKFYDVFINHKGPDTKETVAFALYDLLEERGFKTFFDDEELEPGDPIEGVIRDAICSSSVQIAIVSPKYAESPWCLNELVDMLKTQSLVFIPVFCDVKPSDVRRPESKDSVYKDAFADHEKNGRYSKEKRDEWKEALRRSSLLSGYEFSTSNGNIEMLCSKIASAVQQKVGNTILGFPKYVEDPAKLSQSSAPKKKNCLLPRDSNPVGIDSKFKDMECLLSSPENQVIAVVGMGGLGKTFLLQYVFNALESRYHHSIWLSISQYYSVKSLQRDIASHIGLKSEIVDGDVSEETAAVLIHGRLKGKRCLIVLDDLWKLSTEDNLLDKLALPADKDCKVVVSSRNREVATYLNAQIYEMKKLPHKESWELFCSYAFPDCKENRAPSYLEEEGRKIVKQCGNLPLAIKTTAASLANSKSLREWESKRRQLERAVIPFGEHYPVMDILRMSYDSLPAHLKPCFAFLSFFPEDERIDCEYLVCLWMAEGFIPAIAGEEQWDIAWNWLDRLAKMCLLELREDLEGDDTYGNLRKFCVIHDLLHDLAIIISRENKCVFSLEEALTYSTHGWCRIFLAKKNIRTDAISHCLSTYLRTLSLSQNWTITSIPENMFSAMRRLRVLDLSCTQISALPESVGKMILLRVLNLKDTKIREVPECVRHLRSLVFLAMPSACSEIPYWKINQLECLQHLECEGVDFSKQKTSKLVSLRTLRSKSCVAVGSIEKDLGCMNQLQEIGLSVESETDVKRIEEGLLAHLVKMRHLRIENWIGQLHLGKRTSIETLRRVFIWNIGSEFIQQLPEKLRAMKHLESLALKMFWVPSWICDFENLGELELCFCDCIEYPELQRMPNLVSLKLIGNEGCSKLPEAFGKSGAFPRLRFFLLFDYI